MDKLNIGIIFGGVSTEHEVSRRSAVYVLGSLDLNLFNYTMLEINKNGEFFLYEKCDDIKEIKREIPLIENNLPKIRIDISTNFFRNTGIDVVFPVIHGTEGEDGVLQGLFELSGIPYVGAGVAGSAVAFDKIFTKEILEMRGIRQAGYIAVKKEDDIGISMDNAEEKLGYPIFVKPANGGSSVGIYKAVDRKSLEKAIGSAFQYDRKIILEEAVMGKELECAVIGGYESARALGIGEIVPCNEFYDYNAKYIDEDSKVIVPAGIGTDIAELIMEEAVRAFIAVDAYGLARVDFFLGKDNEIYLNEINTMPGFTSISMFPKLWRYDGGTDETLITKLIELALERKEKYVFLKDYKPND